MILRVTKFGEPVLRQQGEPVEKFDEELRKFAADMLETMYDEEGIGLAAQQVDRAVQVCVIDLQLPEERIDFSYQLDGRTPPLELMMPLVMVNPEIDPRGVEEAYEEGCLSFPDIRGDVIRPTSVRARYKDLDGAAHTIEADGLLARVIQHEVDHINGVLFIDRMERRTVKGLESKLKKLKRSTRDWLKAQKKERV